MVIDILKQVHCYSKDFIEEFSSRIKTKGDTITDPELDPNQ